MIDFLMVNIYIKIGNHLFRQCIGIPMGTNCAPLLANLLSAIEADGKEAIIMGDTNCANLNQPNNDTKHMKKIAHKLGFSYIIKEATRTTAETKTNMDHIFTNKPEFVRISGVIHCGISDHDTVYKIGNMRVGPSYNFKCQELQKI